MSETPVAQTADTETPAGIMDRLRAETAERHKAAENREFQRRMVGGEISEADYRRWLVQMRAVHEALERELDQHLNEPAFAAVDRDQFKEPLLAGDLEGFDHGGGEGERLPATGKLAARIRRDAAERPVALLGHHYVLEGSTNGNRFVARRLREAFGRDARFSYLDPYGEAQRERWLEFRRRMAEVDLSADEQDAIVEAAKAMFDGIGEISVELNVDSGGES